MRRAAQQWGVNLHTVRHAYTALARDGLVEMRSSRGTRVTGVAAGHARAATPARVRTSTSSWARLVREARERHGISALELAAKLSRGDAATDDRRPSVAVLECSAWQCESHAAELRERWNLEAIPWPLAGPDMPGGDAPRTEAILATYFHYNDIRRRWPQLLRQVHFVTIRPDAAVVEQLSAGRSVIVVDRDEPTVQAVAADLLAAAHGLRLRTVVARHPADILSNAADGELVLITPRLWSTLAEVWRRHPQALELRYRYDDTELEHIAAPTRLASCPRHHRVDDGTQDMNGFCNAVRRPRRSGRRSASPRECVSKYAISGE